METNFSTNTADAALFSSNCITLESALQALDLSTPEKFIIPGVRFNSLGFVYGPPKSGKTIYVENLFYAIAAEKNDFLGNMLNWENPKCLFISLEENFRKQRLLRNYDQLKIYDQACKEKILKNYVVSGEGMPQYVLNDNDWNKLYAEIELHNPGFVCIDSLSRLTQSSIADEETAKKICVRLKRITDNSNITLFVINHVIKNGNENGLNMWSMSGSKNFIQETDFMIGIDKKTNGRYLTIIASRYDNDDYETVDKFEITENRTINITGKVSNQDYHQQTDGRYDSTNVNKVKEAIVNYCNENKTTSFNYSCIKSLEIEITTQAIYDCLNKLIDKKEISRVKKGEYEIHSKSNL